MPNWSAEAKRSRRQGQQKIRRRCICGRVITGNVGWYSHTHDKAGEEKPDHRYDGRA